MKKKEKFIPVNEPLLIGNEKKYLTDCINSGWVSSDGPLVKKFEKKFAEYVSRAYASTVSSGSAALDLAFKAIGLEKNDEVILPSFTIISCLLPILKAGAKPVFIDCNKDNWNMNTQELEKKITKKTKAILAVHIYGLPSHIVKIKKIAKKFKIYLIEDAAEAHGITVGKKRCGSFGDISTFSFYANKHITTGEGGMLVTDNKFLIKKINYYKNLCFGEKQNRFIHEEEGWNYRMSNLQAAVGLAQLEKISNTIKIKKNIGKLYNKFLQSLDHDFLQLPQKSFLNSLNHYWVYGILLNPKYKVKANEFCKRLNKRGVGTRPFFYPLHKQPILKKYKFKIRDKFPNTELISNYGLYLPSGVGLRKDQIKYVIKILKDTISEYI